MEKKRKIRKKMRISTRIVISVILGFLPSFLFILFFVQYGSPFLNYLKFLSDFNSSWAAWISAVVIAFLTYFMGGIIRSFVKLKNRFLLLIFIACLIVVLILVATQMYLYVNSTLSNDILTQLSSDKSNIYFTNNTQDNVSFITSATMNPFCSAQCQYDFFDISTGKEIGNGSFILTSILSKTETYTFYNNYLIQGSQEIMRFQVSCWSEKTFLCYTKGENSTRATIITVNYNLTAEDEQYKEDSKNQIISLGQDLYSINSTLNTSAQNINLINNYFSTENFSDELTIFSGVFLNLSSLFENVENLWEVQNFTELKNELPDSGTQIQNLSDSLDQLNSEINSSVDVYNNITENINSDRNVLVEISNINLTASLCLKLNSTISDFNSAISNFSNVDSIYVEESIEGNISSEINSLYNNISNSNSGLGSMCFLNTPINNDNITEISIIQGTLTQNFSLNNPSPICCYFGKCEQCCNNTCSDEDYPIIFVHGYSLTTSVPVGYGLDSFSEMKEDLSSENYIDAGGIIINSTGEDEGLWGEVHAPIEISASYFFDTYQTGSTETTVSSDTDSIDTFAIRLNNLINIMKYRTNKDKVIIVAHSMGGLVARRYIQIFGGDSVDKLILITTPNNGIEGKVESYCGIFGPAVPCSEMDQGSLFLNQLNMAQTNTVPTYNIIGIGCNMGNETGDGILTNSTQYLDYATNFYVQGTCDELNFNYLHENIIYPDQYPEVYSIIKNIIQS